MACPFEASFCVVALWLRAQESGLNSPDSCDFLAFSVFTCVIRVFLNKLANLIIALRPLVPSVRLTACVAPV